MSAICGVEPFGRAIDPDLRTSPCILGRFQARRFDSINGPDLNRQGWDARNLASATTAPIPLSAHCPVIGQGVLGHRRLGQGTGIDHPFDVNSHDVSWR